MQLFKIYIHIYTITWFLLLLHTLFVTFLYVPEGTFTLDKFLFLITGLITIIVQIQLAKLLSFGHKTVSFVLTLLLLISYALLYTFHYNQHVPLDFALVYENFSLLFYKESIDSLLAMLSISYLFYAIITIFFIYYLNRRYHLISHVPLKGELTKTTFATILFLNIFLIYAPIKNSNKINEFVESVRYFNETRASSVSTNTPESYPYVHFNKISGTFSHEKNPHVFLIFMESYNGLFTDNAAKNGKEVTPFFNKLKENGLFIENFYGHSIQTSKGQFGTLAGVLPSAYSKVFTTYGNLNLYALPSILNDHGYETVFTKAYKSLSFDNTRNYAKKLGFKHIDSLGEAKRITKEDEGKIWGWGLQDDRYYDKFFNYIDNIHAQERKKPIFATLTTVSNHMMFDKIPDDQKYLYADANSNYKNFMNSLHLADRYLESFFDELKKRDYLKNSIVIITGDHSWPSGDHGYWHNETSFYNEFFKIPLLILWDGVIAPKHVQNITRSQIDIAPTILDMLNIRVKNHFMGESMFMKQRNNTVYLVQPYSGTYIIAQEDQFKYVKHMKDKREYLFNLSKDPKEQKNIIHDPQFSSSAERLRKKALVLLTNDKLIRENRIWPKKKSSKKAMVQNNFTLKISQQLTKVRALDDKTDEAYSKHYDIDLIDFKNSSEFTHKSLGKLNFKSNFFTEIKGDFEVKKAGQYDLWLESDDGFRLFIDQIKVAEFTGGRAMKGDKYSLFLEEGSHSISLKHYQGFGNVGLRLRYRAADQKDFLLFGSTSQWIKFSH